MDFGPMNFDRHDQAFTRSEKSCALKAAFSKLKDLIIGFASWFGLRKENYIRQTETLVKPNLRMTAGSFNIARNTQADPSGEDAHFVNDEEETVGVADGVGGWKKKGVDSGKYARMLMHCAAEAARVAGPDPKRILRAAFRGASNIPLGSSTACILTHRDGVLRVANVGDSGFLVFRRGALLTRSRLQCHRRSSNSPFQLGNMRDTDKPSCAEEYQLAVVAGDVVVVATDGVLDNLFVDQIEDLLVQGFMRRSSPQVVAETIAEAAHMVSMDKKCSTPLSSKKSASTGRLFAGGKKDDITVVVGVIIDVLE